MTEYAARIVSLWKSRSIPGQRNASLARPDGTLPNETFERIVLYFDFPFPLQERVMLLGRELNTPALLSQGLIKNINPPNDDKDGNDVFQAEFELIDIIYHCFSVVPSDPPYSQDIKRELTQRKRKVRSALLALGSALDISDRYSKALIMSALGYGIASIESRLNSLLDDVKSANLTTYRVRKPDIQKRAGAILALAYSYYYCFGELPKTTLSSVFFQYVERFFELNSSIEVSSDSLIDGIKVAVQKLKLDPNLAF